MNNPTDAFTKNSWVDKCMKMIPDDPLLQSRYMYYLTVIVFTGLMGFAIATWYSFFTTWGIRNLFSGLFMSAIGLMSLFGLKQTRAIYKATKYAYQNKPKNKIESIEDMQRLFNNAEIHNKKG